MPNDYRSDIMYLNKQRLLAMEELGRVNNERNSLLQRIEQLEMQNQATARKGSHATNACSSHFTAMLNLILSNSVIAISSGRCRHFSEFYLVLDNDN